MIKVLKAISHQHNLEEDILKLSRSIIPINKAKNNYLADLLEINSRKNSGKLADFDIGKRQKLFYENAKSILDNKNIVNATREIMTELIKVETLPQSTSGNYIFILYHIQDVEQFLDDNGKVNNTNINENRFAMLKFEFQDSHHIVYNEKDNTADIHIENKNGLPNEHAKVKKAVFVNNFNDNPLNYQLRVIDRESSDVAEFFTNRIVKCKYKIRSQYYLPSLRKQVTSFNRELREEGIICEEESKQVLDSFSRMMKIGNTIDQSELFSRLWGAFIEDDTSIEKKNDLFLHRLNESGLTYNRFEVSSKDLNMLYKNQQIYFSKNGYLRFSKSEIDNGTLIIPESKEMIGNSSKYVIKILLDNNPKEEITKKGI